MIAAEPGGRQFIAVLAAALRYTGKAGTNLDPLNRIDSHHGMGNIRVEAIKQRLTQPNRNPSRLDKQPSANRVARSAQIIHVGFELRDHGRIGCKKRVFVDQIPRFKRNNDLTQLRHASAHTSTGGLKEPLAGDRTSRHRSRRQAGRGATATARITNSVLVVVRIVGVARAEGLSDCSVILAARVGVLNHQSNRSPRGSPFKDSRKYLYEVGLLSLRDVARGARPSTIQIGLNVRCV